MLRRGVLAEMAPQIAKGALAEMLAGRKVDVEKVTLWVQNNSCLWDTLKPAEQDMLRRVRGDIGELDWLTADWIIDAIKDDSPAVASLFLGWKKANNWLERQARIIKEKIG